jgi:hypothetical protein
MNLGDVRSQREHAEAAIDLAGDEAPPIAHVMEAQWHLWNDDAAACLAAAEAAPAVEADNPTMRLLASNMVVSALGELGREAEMRAQLPTIGALTDQVGSPTLTTASQFAIAEALETLGHSRESRIWWTKALQTSVAAEGPSVAAFAHIGAARRADGLENAIALYRAALPIVRDYLAGWHQSYPLVIAAGLAARLGHPRPAAQLIGHFDRAMHEMGVRGRRADVRDRDELCERLDGALGPDELARSLAEGAELTATQAIELALEALSPEGTEDSTSGALGADRPRTAG